MKPAVATSWRSAAVSTRVFDLLSVSIAIVLAVHATHLPWWLVLAHVTVAATVWTAVAAFGIRFWRPGEVSKAT